MKLQSLLLIGFLNGNKITISKGEIEVEEELAEQSAIKWVIDTNGQPIGQLQ